MCEGIVGGCTRLTSAPDFASQFVPTLAEALTTSYQRCMERHTALAEDEDADEMAHALVAQQDDDEQEFLTSIVDAIGFLVRTPPPFSPPTFLSCHTLTCLCGYCVWSDQGEQEVDHAGAAGARAAPHRWLPQA